MAQISLEQALEMAMQRHREGKLQEAEQLYRQVLNVAPNHPPTLEQFGLLALDVGRAEIAAELLKRAAAGNPSSAQCQYNLGLALATAGQIPPAIAAYRQALALKPDLVEACNNLAVLMINTGDADRAIELCRKAIQLRPELAEAHQNLGSALRLKGLLNESIAAHRQGTVLQPQSAEAWCGLGIALGAAGRTPEAIEAYQRALALNPDLVDALENLAAIYHKTGKGAAALALVRRAVAVRPNMPETLSNLAAILLDDGAVDEAIEHLRRALTIKPDFAEAYSNLGLALRLKGQLPQAAEAYQKSVSLKPHSHESLRGLGQVYQLMGRTDEAIASYEKSLAVKPDYAEGLSSLGTALMEQRRIEEGTAAFRKAIAIQPSYPLAHFNLSQVLLLTGNWIEAWAEQEWRWKASDLKLPEPKFSQPRWDGADLNGRRILVHAEQGFGDTIQFARYLPLVAQRGGRVIFLCHSSLKALLLRSAGIDQCVAFDEPMPTFDVHIPLMSLPGIFQTTLETIPPSVPYIHADPELVRAWRAKVEQSSKQKMKIGLVWAGRPDQKNDRNRSMPLAALAPLAQVPGISWHSLQKGDAARQLTCAPAGMEIIDWSGDLNDFSDTAALLESLDLLISADTAPAHLAGAMGRPVWVLAAFFADWRYLLNRSDNPWYPTMRVFRQPRAGDWQSPVNEVIDLLRKLTGV